MHVNKSYLERKTNEELQGYVAPRSRYVARAIVHAYAILQERNHPFLEEEAERIERMIAQKEQDELFFLHPYHQKVSRLLYLSSGIGLGFLLGFYNQIGNTSYIVLSLIYFLAIIALGYVVSHGYTEVRYALSILGIAGILGIAMDYSNVMQSPVFALVAGTQLIMLCWAIVILFRIPQIRKEIAAETA